MTRSMLVVLVVTLGVPLAARAQDALVLARLPVERRAEMMAALRVELAGRATLMEGEAPGDEATDASMRAQAADATHVVWVVFPGGMLEPAEVRVLDVARSSAARARTPQAWDVVDARVVGVLAASLLEPAPLLVEVAPDEAAQSAAAAAIEPRAIEARPIEPRAIEPAPAPPIAEPAPALALTGPQLRGARPARTFSLWLGLGVAHTNGRGLDSQALATGQSAFYARMSDWISIGLRLRGGFGASSIEGAVIEAGIGLPGLALSFRESLGTAAAIELGIHAEGGLNVNWRENRTRGEDQLSFGVGVGAFATVELGAASGLMLDYTVEVYGLGGVHTWLWGSATLAYVHRWD